MSNALKIADKLEVSSINEQLESADELINSSLNKCDEIIDRNWLERLAANNTKDLGEIQQLQSMAIKNINRISANSIKAIIDNTQVQRKSLEQIELFRNKIQFEKNEREALSIQFKNEIENLANDNINLMKKIENDKKDVDQKFNFMFGEIAKLKKENVSLLEEVKNLQVVFQKQKLWLILTGLALSTVNLLLFFKK